MVEVGHFFYFLYKLMFVYFITCIFIRCYRQFIFSITDFWSKVTGIPVSQFIKPYQKANSGLYKKEGYQGCANVTYSDVTISRELRAVAQECILVFNLRAMKESDPR
jgi:hypothetical protein